MVKRMKQFRRVVRRGEEKGRRHKNSCVAVYGRGRGAEELLRRLKGRGVRGKRFLAAASRYVLMGSEEENLSFYLKYRERLRDKQVYMKCDCRAFQAEDANLHFFCPEEIGARLYWRQAGLYQEARQKEYRLKIAILGFGKLEWELLRWGLQNHIFSPAQRLEYHVFGEGGRFLALHHELGQLEDAVIFHREPWYESLSLLEEADRILMQDGWELRELLFALPGKTVDVLAKREGLVSLLEARERLRVFFWKKEAGLPEHIFREELLAQAKELNLQYACLYGNAERTKESREAQWRGLSAFARYSNISSADYHETRLQMQEDWNREHPGAQPDAEWLEYLAHLEHIRWSRYHYLNNWRLGEPEDGKNKDVQRRIHKDLVPYEALSQADREKDREKVRLLLRMRF